jgi:ubiquinone/menaquinone biosynthesis C-methylase UbiE
MRMVGLDLSHGMLTKLVEHAGGAPPFPLVLGDATRLPFADGSFGAMLGVHVLHLIPRWRIAVAEFLRVLQPGGTVLVGLSEQDEIGGAIVEAVAGHFGEPDQRHRGLVDVADLDAEMAAHGLEVRRLPEIPVVRRASIDRILETIEEQRWSWTWRYGADEIREAAQQVRGWAAQRFGDLDEERTLRGTLAFHAYDVPRGGL